MQKFEPNLSFGSNITLSLYSTPEALKDAYINSLNVIISELEKYDKLIELLSDISEYQSLINKDNLEVPEALSDLADKIKVIIIIANTYDKKIIQELKNIFENTRAKISASINTDKSDDTLTLKPTPEYEDIIAHFLEAINSLFSKVGRFSLISSVLNGEDDCTISRYIKTMKEAIANLDETHQEELNHRYQTFRQKYDLNYISNNTYEDIIESITNDLFKVMTALNKVNKSCMIFKTIIDALSNSLNIVKEEPVKNMTNSLIEEVTIRIVELLKNDSIPNKEKANGHQELLTVLTKWSDKLKENDYNTIIEEVHSHNNQITVSTNLKLREDSDKPFAFQKADWSELDDSTALELIILSELTFIKNCLETYLSDKEIVKGTRK
ncbi:MAG: hypothetical protein K2J20_04595 [Bacilli bacterium]|nr:hypothetical protein [Bacilli bacterium]